MDYQPRWSESDDGYDNAADVEDVIRRSVRPDPILTVSQWADRFRVLSTKLAAEAGAYRTSRTPFLRDVMDALSPTHPARRVVFMKAAQVGATEAGNNWLGFIMHWSPAPVMGVWPTVDTAKKVSQQRIAPLIEDSPELAKLVSPAKQRDSGNTVLAKSFPGGILVMTGANSGVGLRSMPARYAFLDEVDAYPGDVDGEGDPVALVANRTTTFGRSAKMFLVSTPTIHGESRIEREYEMSDQRRYFVPCPHCDEPQWLKFERLRWTWGDPTSVRYVCEACDEPFEERHKAEFLPAGEWRPTAIPRDPGCVGFHISALYSPLGWMSWEDLAREWEAAEGKPESQKAFKNTRLGETWFQAGEQVEWERIYARRESWKPGTLPRGVTILNAAVDVQASPARLELHVWGWGEGLESWAIERREFPGRADDPDTWKGIDAALDETWTHASGAELRIERLAVDTGDQTTAVYAWISKQDQARVHAIKGKKGFEINAPVATPTFIPFGSRKKAIQLRSVTGDVFKAELYRFLGLERPTDEEIRENGFPVGYVHIPDYLDAEWCKQLVAERRVRTKLGRFEWKNDHGRNEALDCRIYARAALWITGVAAWKSQKWVGLRERRGLDIQAQERVDVLDRAATAAAMKRDPSPTRGPRVTMAQDPYL
nr:phage terminase large subunit family protein [Methylobacterium sp. OTU13CASTA1]